MAYNSARLRNRVVRVRSAVGRGTVYGLGKGGFDPKTARPGSFDSKLNKWLCDCTGCGAWGFEVSRKPKESRPWWFESTNIYRDATGQQTVFVRIKEPVPGCALVYPDRLGRQGHFAIVTQVSNKGEIYGVDCASHKGEAIRERDLKWMLKRGAVPVLLKEDLL